jgi:uncharacterized protein (TIGR02145 family)
VPTTIIGPDGITYGWVTAKDGRTWLDRNLGATQVAEAENDTAAYGALYQWGRFCDGHQVPSSGTTTTQSAGDTPGDGNFIYSHSDWRATANDLLWQGLTGINNPCPDGYRLPTQAEWATLISTEGITGSATAFASTLKLPVNGARYFATAGLTGQGAYGLYWTSTIAGTNSQRIYIPSGYVDNYAAEYRANGYGIRAIKD